MYDDIADQRPHNCVVAGLHSAGALQFDARQQKDRGVRKVIVSRSHWQSFAPIVGGLIPISEFSLLLKHGTRLLLSQTTSVCCEGLTDGRITTWLDAQHHQEAIAQQARQRTAPHAAAAMAVTVQTPIRPHPTPR